MKILVVAPLEVGTKEESIICCNNEKENYFAIDCRREREDIFSTTQGRLETKTIMNQSN